MRLLHLLGVVVSLLAATGCSTIVSRPLQKITATSRPAGAEVLLDEASQGRTPVTFEASRWEDHQVVLQLRGYQPYTVHLTRHVNPWIAGNLFNGLLLGLVVDASTGAIYQLDPPQVQADLYREGVRRKGPETVSPTGHVTAARRPAEFLIATVLQAKPGWTKVGQLESR